MIRSVPPKIETLDVYFLRLSLPAAFHLAQPQNLSNPAQKPSDSAANLLTSRQLRENQSEIITERAEQYLEIVKTAKSETRAYPRAESLLIFQNTGLQLF